MAAETHTSTMVVLGVIVASIAACTSAGDAQPAPATSEAGGLFFRHGSLPGLGADCAARPMQSSSDASLDARQVDGRAPSCIPSRTVSFARDVKPVFGACAGEVCHTETWGSGDPRPFIVGVPATECCDGRLRVAPGNPSGSYVIQKLTGQRLCRGARMPLGSELTADQIQTVSDWICLGARDD